MKNELRYAGKPLLRLLELYVLRAIGELSDIDEINLSGMAPKLQSIYGGGPFWYDSIAAAMDFSPAMEIYIRDTWERNLEIASRKKIVLSPQDFAENFVDENFI